eukprot:scaffold187979_cov42-Prasinocladus_malaysianus.AAC.2
MLSADDGDARPTATPASPLEGPSTSAGSDARHPKHELLQALCAWWDDAGEVSLEGHSAYAPKYQVVCKETIQKLLFAWIRSDAARVLNPTSAALSYQEFASKLGEPYLWSSWWAEKIQPATGVSWGSKGQWCRLYRLHNALPPFVRLRTLQDPMCSYVRDSPWLSAQADVLRCLEDWWSAFGLLLPAKCKAEHSFTVN